MDVLRRVLTTLPSSAEGELSVTKEISIDYIGKKTPEMHQIMMNAGVFGCQICSTRYGEDCRPRNLRCGHTLCSNCVIKYVECHTECPECFLLQPGENVSDFPVNYPLLRMNSSLRSTDPCHEIKLPPILPYFRNSNSHYNEALRCNKHDNPVTFLCCTCNLWICPDCIVLDHPLLPRGSCRTIGVSDAMKMIRNKLENEMNHLLNDIENLVKKIELELPMHSFCLEHCSCYKPTHDSLILRTDDLLIEVKENIGLFVQNAKNKVEKLKMSANLSMSPKDMTPIVTETLAYKDELRTDINKQEVILPLTESIQQHLERTIKSLLEKKGTIYALRQNHQSTRWAPLTLKNDQLMLYTLRDGSPPNDGFILPYEYVRRLARGKKTKIFLEVGTQEESQGFVYISLLNTLYGDQMTLMCSGENGVSYSGTCFYMYDKEDGSIHGGDYQNNDGSGGRPLVTGLGDCYSYSKYGRSAGSLIADKFSTRFRIRLQKKRAVRGVCGTVDEGLDILRELANIRPVTQTFVKDCGLCIPMGFQELDEESIMHSLESLFRC